MEMIEILEPSNRHYRTAPLSE